MKPSPISVAMLVVSLFLAPAVLAQSPDSANQSAASPAPSASAAEVPRLIKFSGTLLDAQDRPMAGPVGVTFALHAQQTGGAALWLETQNVTPDAHGNYTVLLGANSTNGVPAELFASGEARWLEVQVERQAEQPRILLVSVPYALKAKDAETLGGKPASAFVTTETLASAGNSAGAAAAAATARPSSKTQTTPKKAASAPQPAALCASVTSDGTATANSISKFTAACAIQNSAITETGGNVGIGTTAPIRALDIEGGTNTAVLVRGPGTHNVQLTGTSSSGRLGQDLEGFFFASDSKGKVIKFLTENGTGTLLNEWMRITSAGNVGVGTTTPSAKLEIAGGNLALPNTTSSSVGVVTFGGVPFLHNSGTSNTFLGAGAGNFNMAGGFNTATGAGALQNNISGGTNTASGVDALFSNMGGGSNTAIGVNALFSNTSGFNNTASGQGALFLNTIGNDNTASGLNALFSNTTGLQNTASGESALGSNTTGSGNTAIGFLAGSTTAPARANTTGFFNTFIGFQAGPGTSTQLSNATAIGANAAVSESNALVLGSINGINSGTADTNVGIGTATPFFKFHQMGGDHAVEDSDISLRRAGFHRWRIQDLAGSGFRVFQVYNDANILVDLSRFEITDVGNVGIGTAAPDNLLTVNGSADKPGGGSWGTFSDARLKNLHGDFHSGLAEVLKLNPIRYRYKEQNALGIKDQEEHVGFVAQDVQKVIPEAVSADGQGYLLVNNDPILWAMLNAIKEQQMLISRQQDQLQMQRAEIGQLASQVRVMQASLRGTHQSSEVRATKTHMRTGHARATHMIPAAQTGK